MRSVKPCDTLIYIYTVFSNWSFHWSRLGSDLTSMILMNGRAFLVCVVGVSVLLRRTEEKESNVLSSDKKEFSVLNVHRKTSRSPVNHLWLLLSGLLAFSEVLQVGVHFSVLQTRGGWRCSIVCKEAPLPSQSRRTNASHAGELSFNWSEKRIQILTTRLLTSPSRRNTLSSRSLMDRSLSWMTVREFCSCTVNKANRQTTSNTQEKPEAANDDEFFLFSPHVSSWLHSCTSNTLYVSASSKSESRW